GAGAGAGRKIGQSRQVNKFRGAAGDFETIPREDFKRLAPEHRAIGREQDVTVTRRYFKRHEQQLLEIAFHPERLARTTMGERWWIENDGVEFVSTPRQSRQNLQDVVGDELMVIGVESIERKIRAAARQRLARKTGIAR